MNHRTAIAVLSVAVATAALTACGSDTGSDTGDGKPTAKTPPAAAPSTPAAPKVASSPPAASEAPKSEAPKGKGIPPKPDAATQAKYIAALTAIDPDIVNTKPDKAVDRGRNQCDSIANFPKDDQKQIDLTNQRFTSPNHPDGFGPAKAAKIRDAVHTHLCPSY
ncbi:hypothetical protein OOK31_21395 [Streptomyces sp. NBC_00249]|uniref:hypothetical protein n=1 Tax=Streptomyces sp. NBC_00249 TaxID=2975690 RepID=UPI00224E4072|nr:hypothetical protein [Streptomyces sp. NBC_00249]MCX5196421.1 hypothetical protein [Streptomyces sp. NBC_00249]